MKTFGTYFEFGVEHILNWEGLDHILFILALCALYTLRDWRKLLILVTAFTVGHSVTLALAVSGILKINSSWVEFLIPLTILVTAISNLARAGATSNRMQLNYAYAAFFGMVHGLGFANFLSSLLGKGLSILWPLLAFNLGLEVGQLIIVLLFALLAGLVVAFGNVSKREWTLSISAFIAGMALLLVIQSKFW